MTTQVTHTPGPWYLDNGGHIRAECIDSAGFCDNVCNMPFGSESERIEMPEAGANARLIAAAPDLLEACRAALEALHDPDMLSESLTERMLRAALVKAEGK